MRNNILHRLNKLEDMARGQFSDSLIVSQNDSEVILRRKPGKVEVKKFSSVIEATQYLENLFQEKDIEFCSMFVSNICDLFPDVETIRPAVREYLGTDLLPVHCVVNKENFESDLNILEQLFLVKLRCFDTTRFIEGLKKNKWDKEDSDLFNALYFLYTIGDSGEIFQRLPEFWNLIFYVCPGLEKYINA